MDRDFLRDREGLLHALELLNRSDHHSGLHDLPATLPESGLNLLSGGVHASYGRHAYVFAFGRDGKRGDDVGPNGFIRDWTGAPPHMESRLVMKDKR